MAVASGADALGLLAAMPDGSGMLGDAEILAIASHAPPPVSTFLLTAQTSASAISRHIRATLPTTVQIVRHIVPAEAARLSIVEPHVRRVQVVHVEGPDALDLIPAYAPHVHAFLLDSGHPHAAVPNYGGTGMTHDWRISAAFVKACPKPVFLAGGLNAGNVEEAITRVRPYGLDLCSSLRTNGRLDADKLHDFMRAVRAADAKLAKQAPHSS